MAVIQFISNYYKKKINLIHSLSLNKLKIINFNPIIFLSFIVFFSILFFTISNLINIKENENKKNLSEVTDSNEFSNLTNYFISKINSPYAEVSYIIKNNDTIEKILKKFDIKKDDIKKISTKLKKKKISNIY